MSTAPTPPQSSDRTLLGIRVFTVFVLLIGIGNIWFAFQIPHLKALLDDLLEWQPGPHRFSFIFRFHYLVLALAFFWPLAGLAITWLLRGGGGKLLLLWMIFSLSALQGSIILFSLSTQFSALSGPSEIGKK